MEGYLTPKLEESWRNYQSALESSRQFIFQQEWAQDPRIRLHGLLFFHQIQAVAYNLIIAPRQEYPTFFVHTVFEPLVYTHSLPATDFNYRWAFVDGKHDYRLYGKRNGSVFVDCQVMNVFWGQPNPKNLGNYDFDKFSISQDGSFEAIVSANRHDGNWIKIDGDNRSNFLFIREAFNDWLSQPAEIHFERRSYDHENDMELSEDEYICRLQAAENLFKFLVGSWSILLTQRLLKTMGYNRFYEDGFDADQDGGNSPVAVYPTALFDLRDTDALLIECNVPNCRFWNVQLGDMWWQVKDYTYHQSSLNGFQAAIDSDGFFRAIISKTDPGLANWLDPVGDDRGVIIFRFYEADAKGAPTIRPISFQEITDIFKDTEKLTRAERRSRLDLRLKGARQRYGY